MKSKGLIFLRGDCSPKVTPKSGHPWRKAIFPASEKLGRYAVDEQAIDRRRNSQLQAARARRKEAANA